MSLAERLDKAIGAALGDRIVGCVVLVERRGEAPYARAAGLADREAGRAMEEDAIFRLASVTKPVVAACVLRMVDLGRIGLDDPVTKFLPRFRPLSPDGVERPITIRQLLNHTSGLTYGGTGTFARGLSGPIQSLEDWLAEIAEAGLLFAPGTGWEYGMSSDVLGGVVASVNGSDLAGALARHVSGPLGMTDTQFGVTDLARLAVPYADGRPPIRMGEPHVMRGDDGSDTEFSPARILTPGVPQSGGAGLAGTAGDVMRLLRGLAGDFLSPALRDAAFANQIGALPRREGDAGKRFGFLGAVTQDPKAARTALPVGAVDWGGAWGHNWVVDRASGTVIVVCTNTTYEGCNGAFREEIIQAVFGG